MVLRFIFSNFADDNKQNQSLIWTTITRKTTRSDVRIRLYAANPHEFFLLSKEISYYENILEH